MSRIGKAPIEIPAGVTVTVSGDVVTVKGPKGQLSQKVNSDLDVKVEGNHVVVLPMTANTALSTVSTARLSTTWLSAYQPVTAKKWN